MTSKPERHATTAPIITLGDTMNTIDHTARTAWATVLEASFLALEGARAARGGCSWLANPFIRRENMPAATGESVAVWVRKHDAWQRGFDNPLGA